jgi:NitT/TauT family transport system ATP-binding protein
MTGATRAEVAIEVSGASHSFSQGTRALAVLSEVSLSVRSGEMVSLLGPSGCGKSTLLNIVGGVLTPDAGSVLLDGHPLHGIMPHKISFVFQEHALFPWNTVFENLVVALEFQGVPAAERADRATVALDAVRMSEFRAFYPAQLSGGMKQRVALARGLSLETDILLMDEPFAALDEQTRMVFGEDLSVLLAKTGKTIVLVTHSLSEAVFLSDRIFVMTARPGKIKAVVDVPKEHPRTPDFVSSAQFGAIRGELYELLHDEIRASVESAQHVPKRDDG